MEDRIQQELKLLRSRFPNLEYREEGRWIRIPSYPVTEGWSRSATEVTFQIPTSHPGAPPYGIYVPVGLTFRGEPPNNYREPAPSQPPFGGSWGIFSWAPLDGQWRPTADIITGSNLLNWVLGFADRFREGK